MAKSNMVEFAIGWLQKTKNGDEYVSASASKGNPAKGKPGYKLLIQTEDGRTLPVEKFAMFFNENKTSEKSPDVRFVVNEN